MLPPMHVLSLTRRTHRNCTRRTWEGAATHAGIKRCCEDTSPGACVIGDSMHLHTNVTQRVVSLNSSHQAAVRRLRDMTSGRQSHVPPRYMSYR